MAYRANDSTERTQKREAKAMMDETLARKLRLKGITKAARDPFFQGRRKDTRGGNFSGHGCYLCGGKFPCEEETCSHAVYVRLGPCCKPVETMFTKREKL